MELIQDTRKIWRGMRRWESSRENYTKVYSVFIGLFKTYVGGSLFNSCKFKCTTFFNRFLKPPELFGCPRLLKIEFDSWSCIWMLGDLIRQRRTFEVSWPTCGCVSGVGSFHWALKSSFCLISYIGLLCTYTARRCVQNVPILIKQCWSTAGIEELEWATESVSFEILWLWWYNIFIEMSYLIESSVCKLRDNQWAVGFKWMFLK